MKRSLLYTVSFLLAIMAAFATSKKSAISIPPKYYDNITGCAECIIPDSPGNTHNIDYFCSTTPTMIRCTCIAVSPNGLTSKKATSGNATSLCTLLWRSNL